MEKNQRYYAAYLACHQISRRGLLRGVFGGNATARQAVLPTVFRPPFAAEEGLFQYACDGCGKCVESCPYGLIDIKNRRAELEVSFSACDFCTACARACPTGALHPVFSADTHLRPRFNRNCIQQKGQFCDDCLQNCPRRAITRQSRQTLYVDEALCNGCGACKVNCFGNGIDLIKTTSTYTDIPASVTP